jgi:hypothetical protein
MIAPTDAKLPILHHSTLQPHAYNRANAGPTLLYSSERRPDGLRLAPRGLQLGLGLDHPTRSPYLLGIPSATMREYVPMARKTGYVTVSLLFFPQLF